MRHRAHQTGERRCTALALCAALVALVPALCLARGKFGRTQRMLQELGEERQQAARSGESAKFSLAYIDERLRAIGEATNRELSSVLGGPSPPACGLLQDELRRALGYRGRVDPNVAAVKCVPWRAHVYYVAGYALAGTPTYSRSWVGVFGPSPSGGRYRLLAAVENSLPSKTVDIEPLPARGGAELRFLAYGINWGDAHNRLTVIAYSFNGATLRAIWSRRSLAEGRVGVEDGRIKLTFLSSPLGPGHRSVHGATEVYRVSSSAIKLESRSQGPRD